MHIALRERNINFRGAQVFHHLFVQPEAERAQHEHGLRVLGGQVQVMNGDDNERAAGLHVFMQAVKHLHLVANVQRAGGFVQQKQAGLADQALGQQHQLLLAAGEGGHGPLVQVGNAKTVQHLKGALDQAGRTPNPDVLCNAEIKFKAFLDHAMRLGAEKIATGHYARQRLNPATGRHELLKGADPAKDQSYFLHRLTQAQLSRALFPVGDLRKSDVRRIAAEAGLPNAKKKDSTGICFIGERPFREFLGRYLQTRPGPIKTSQGRTIGQHMGLSFYTLGQRQGLGIGGIKEKGAPRGGGDHAPWFVARKDMAANTLYAVQGHDHPWLLSESLTFGDASWIAGEPPPLAAFSAKTRYRQQDAACTLQAGSAPDTFCLRFAQPQWAVTPGQSAVLYDGPVCLGGGIIL